MRGLSESLEKGVDQSVMHACSGPEALTVGLCKAAAMAAEADKKGIPIEELTCRPAASKLPAETYTKA